VIAFGPTISPLFDDDKTHRAIYAWIKDKLHRSSPLTHA